MLWVFLSSKNYLERSAKPHNTRPLSVIGSMLESLIQPLINVTVIKVQETVTVIQVRRVIVIRGCYTYHVYPDIKADSIDVEPMFKGSVHSCHIQSPHRLFINTDAFIYTYIPVEAHTNPETGSGAKKINKNKLNAVFD